MRSARHLDLTASDLVAIACARERGDLAFEAAQLHVLLDDWGVPARDEQGRRYPVSGRVAWLVLPRVRAAWDAITALEGGV